jgi:hypothetical protein
MKTTTYKLQYQYGYRQRYHTEGHYNSYELANKRANQLFTNWYKDNNEIKFRILQEKVAPEPTMPLRDSVWSKKDNCWQILIGDKYFSGFTWAALGAFGIFDKMREQDARMFGRTN